VKRQRHALKRRINQQGISRGNSGSSAPPSSAFCAGMAGLLLRDNNCAGASQERDQCGVFARKALTASRRWFVAEQTACASWPGANPTSSNISNVFVEPLFGGRGRSGRAAAEAGGARRFGLAGHDCGGQGIAERVWAVARARFRLA